MAIWAGIITAVVGAGLSAGLAAASAPDFPDPTKSSRATVLAALRALPGQRAVEQAARLGTSVDYPTGRMVRQFETRNMSLASALKEGFITQQEYNRHLNSTLTQGKGGVGPPNSNIDPNTTMIDVQIPKGSVAETRHVDFTGYGDADIQGRLARANAANTLELQQKYGEDFAREALRQQALADPEGTAARALLADKINEMEAARKTRERPVAEALDRSVMDEVDLGRGVDSATQDAIARTLARRGDTTLETGDVSDEMARGLQGEERLRQRLQKGTGYLSSGVSPEDAAYREEQQSLANMANFLGGRTPQSQFSSLSGGQQGASPQARAPGLPGVDPNLMQQGAQAGLQNYSAGVRAAANQVSPWFAGLNLAVNGANAAGAAGWKPFG